MSGPGPGWQGQPPAGPEHLPGGSGPQAPRSSHGPLILALAIVAVAGLVVGLAWTLAGDSSSDGGGDEGPTADELTTSLAERIYDRSDGGSTRDEAACTAERIVEGIGLDRLTELGMTSGQAGIPFDEMAEGEQRRVATWMYDCVSDDRLVEYIAGLLPPERAFDERLCFAEGQVRMLGADRVREVWVEFTVDPEADLYFVLEDERERDAMQVLEDQCYGSGGAATG
jgi:hypothetical protein